MSYFPNMETYDKICKDLNNWPDWKKRAYNSMFSSVHSKRLILQEESTNGNKDTNES